MHDRSALVNECLGAALRRERLDLDPHILVSYGPLGFPTQRTPPATRARCYKVTAARHTA